MSGLAFSPVRATLASCSWDRTLCLWSVFDERGGSDTVQLSADGEGRGGGEGRRRIERKMTSWHIYPVTYNESHYTVWTVWISVGVRVRVRIRVWVRVRVRVRVDFIFKNFEPL